MIIMSMINKVKIIVIQDGEASKRVADLIIWMVEESKGKGGVIKHGKFDETGGLSS